MITEKTGPQSVFQSRFDDARSTASTAAAVCTIDVPPSITIDRASAWVTILDPPRGSTTGTPADLAPPPPAWMPSAASITNEPAPATGISSLRLPSARS